MFVGSLAQEAAFLSHIHVSFHIAVTKYLVRSNLKERRFIVFHGLRKYSPWCEKGL